MCLAVLSGLLLTCAFPKFGSPALAWVALVPLLVATGNRPAGERFRLGMVAGIVHFLTLTYWLTIAMQTYGGMNLYAGFGVLLLLAAYLAVYVGGFTVLLGTLAPTPRRCLVAVPALWTTLEFIRAKALTGFPWELLGYSQYKTLQIIQISDIFGVYGISFLVSAVNAGLFLMWLFAGNGTWRDQGVTRKTAAAAVLSILLLLGATVCYGVFRMRTIRMEAASAPQVSIAVLQGNIPQDVKWDPAFQDTTTETYLRLSREAAAEAADLIVWPETATPFYFQRAAELTRRIEAEIKAVGAYFIIGSPAADQIEGALRYYNSAYLMTPGGTVSERYDKQHLVPFGEYVPLKKWLPFVDKMVTGMGDFSPGQSGAVLPWAKGRIGVQICYEVIFPALSRRAVQNQANLLVYISNDAWYGKSSAPYQLFSMAVLRAVETRRSVVRAANTGISGFMDPTGRILAQTPLFEEAARTCALPVLETKTVYTRWGDWFPAACGIWVVFFLLSAVATTHLTKSKTKKEKKSHVLRR